MKTSIKQLFLMLMMLASAAIALAMQPVRMQINESQRMDYEYLIPKEFGSWRMLPANVGSIINPQVEATLGHLYSQIVTRTYLDSMTGKTVMLSIAYGEVQNKQSQIHLPEVCYPAQGFEIVSSMSDMLQTSVGDIPVKRVLARAINRTEPITYWIRLGDSIVRGNFEQKIQTIRQGFSGQMSDGLIFRVSAIDSDIEQAYELQNRFIQEVINVTQPKFRHLLIGEKLAGN